MSEPRTHYDENDSHGYSMNDVLDPGDVDQHGNRYSDEEEMEASLLKAIDEADDESDS